MSEPTEAQVEAAVAAYWKTWDAWLGRATGEESRAANMRNRPEIVLLVQACMRAALIAAEGAR